MKLSTGKSFSEALILASTNPQYEKDCSLISTWKLQTQKMYTTCSELEVFMYRTGESMNNLLSYCGLIDARIRVSNKDLPVSSNHFVVNTS